ESHNSNNPDPHIIHHLALDESERRRLRRASLIAGFASHIRSSASFRQSEIEAVSKDELRGQDIRAHSYHKCERNKKICSSIKPKVCEAWLARLRAYKITRNIRTVLHKNSSSSSERWHKRLCLCLVRRSIKRLHKRCGRSLKKA